MHGREPLVHDLASLHSLCGWKSFTYPLDRAPAHGIENIGRPIVFPAAVVTYGRYPMGLENVTSLMRCYPLILNAEESS